MNEIDRSIPIFVRNRLRRPSCRLPWVRMPWVRMEQPAVSA